MSEKFFLTALRRRVAKASAGPGVYRWLDSEGNVLYVGKAKNLKHRLNSYVQNNRQHSAWTEIMLRNVADFDCTVTNTELEALMLETNLIKRYRPKYNIVMKDDKNYVYVQITMKDQYPRIDVVRRMEDDGSLYFGPKTSAYEVKGALSFLRTLFPYRTCKMRIEVDSDEWIVGRKESGTTHYPLSTTHSSDVSQLESKPPLALDVVCTDRDRPTPCIDHHIKQCVAPCIGTITPEDYRKECIDGVISFFEGNYKEVEKMVRDRMQEAATKKKYEVAAKLRDQLSYIQRLQEKQMVSDTSGENADVIGVAVLSGRAHVVVLKEREGKLVDEQSIGLKGQAENIAQVLDQFIPEYYDEASDIPDVVIMGEVPEDPETLAAWLSLKKGKKVELRIPERGKKSKQLELAERNAHAKAQAHEASWEAEARKSGDAIAELQKILHLEKAPKRIEGFDISHMGGNETVCSMVVFVDGKPKREHYRSFNMRTVVKGDIDDYRSIKEALKRRLKYLVQDLKREEAEWNGKGITFGKARKDDHDAIVRIIQDHPENLSADAIDTKQFCVARKGEEVVAICRIFEHQSGLLELRSVCVAKEHRGQKLGQFLVRRMLKNCKEKIYIYIDPKLEEYYAEIGFRHIQRVPPALQAKIDQSTKESPGLPPGVAMVLDPKQHKPNESFLATPDLLLIDGGKGQLGVAVEALKEAGLTVPVVSIAKREEELFVPGNPIPIGVPKDSPAQFLLQRVRDEAHRFANDRRERRGKNALFE